MPEYIKTHTDREPLTIKPEPWMRGTPCATNPDAWFPEKERSTQAADAARVCRGCPAREACLAYALEHDETEGVWGGTTPHERAALRSPSDAARFTWRGHVRTRERWTDAQRETVMTLRAEGVRYAEIAERVGRSTKAIKHFVYGMRNPT